jgi:hypothetical protein
MNVLNFTAINVIFVIIVLLVILIDANNDNGNKFMNSLRSINENTILEENDLPTTVISPFVGEYMFEIVFNNVVLPDPLCPTIATFSPFEIIKLIFFKAFKVLISDLNNKLFLKLL